MKRAENKPLPWPELELLRAAFGLALMKCPDGHGLRVSFCDGAAPRLFDFDTFPLDVEFDADEIARMKRNGTVAVALVVCTGRDHESTGVVREMSRLAYDRSGAAR